MADATATLIEPTADDLEMARSVFALAGVKAPDLEYTVASMLATERFQAAELMRKFASQIDARVIVTRDRVQEQAQMLRNTPAALRKIADTIR